MNKFRWLFLNTAVWLGACKAFAETKVENLSDEFFNAAMQVETPKNTGELGIDAGQQAQAAPAGAVAPADSVAEQVGEDTLASGSDVLLTVKNFFSGIFDKIQDAGNSASDFFGQFTGGNPFITKLIVALTLALICIIVLVVIILLAKKFFLKKRNNDEYQDDDEEFDESDFDNNSDDENFEELDENTFEPQPAQTTQKHTSTVHTHTIPLAPADSVQSAIRIFLKVTE